MSNTKGSQNSQHNLHNTTVQYPSVGEYSLLAVDHDELMPNSAVNEHDQLLKMVDIDKHELFAVASDDQG